MTCKIWYPNRTSSGEIQSLLWYFLRKRKIDAHMEVSGDTDHDCSWTKLDIVVFDKSKAPVCIIECKSWGLRYSIMQKYREAQNTHQIKKYIALYGIPVFVIGRADQINFIVSKIEGLLKDR